MIFRLLLIGKENVREMVEKKNYWEILESEGRLWL
jgi:hypothetical protein